MEDLIAKIGWKKIAIFCFAVSLIGLLMVVLSYQTPGATKPKSKEVSKSGEDAGSTVVRGSFSIPESNQNITPYYGLEYPAYYTEQKIPQSGTLSYSELTESARNLKIKIAVYDASLYTMETLAKPYQGLDYEPEVYPIGEQRVHEFFKIEEGDTRLVHKIIFLLKDGKIIKVDFSYTGTSPDFEAERDFVRIVSSIK